MSVDTDVVVLAVTGAPQHLNILELWVAFCTGKSFGFIPAHEIARALGPDWCIALPMFHAFTVCGTVSSLVGRVHGTPGMHMEMSLQCSVPWLPGRAHNA